MDRFFGRPNRFWSGRPLTLAAEWDSAGVRVSAPGRLRGALRIPLSDPDAPSEVVFPASAFVDGNGRATVMISTNPTCRDCNDLELVGYIDGREISGSYVLRLGDGAPTGSLEGDSPFGA